MLLDFPGRFVPLARSDFRPGLPAVFASGAFRNTHTGPAIEPQPGDWSATRNFLGNVICGGDAVSYRIMELWLAHLVQEPRVLPELPIGVSGPGREVFGIDLMRSLVGADYHLIETGRQISQSRRLCANKLALYVADDAFNSTRLHARRVLDQAYADRMVVKGGREPECVHNCVRVVVGAADRQAFSKTDGKWFLPIPADGPIDAAAITDPRALAAMVYDLGAVELNGFPFNLLFPWSLGSPDAVLPLFNARAA